MTNQINGAASNEIIESEREKKCILLDGKGQIQWSRKHYMCVVVCTFAENHKFTINHYRLLAISKCNKEKKNIMSRS